MWRLQKNVKIIQIEREISRGFLDEQMLQL
jgi:hypothetical protein